MQQPQMTIIQRLNDAFAEAIIEKPFPVERLSENWREMAAIALDYASPGSLGVSAEIFKKLALMDIRQGYSLSFFEFATLSNNLETKSARDLEIGIGLYCELITEAHEHVKYYTEQIGIIRKEIELKIANEDAGKKVVGFGKIKAEA